MFYLLTICVCFAVFFLALFGATLLSVPFASVILRKWNGTCPRISVAAFLLRCAPWSIALLVTLGFALPSILELEPHSTRESVGIRLALLAVSGALLLVVSLARAASLLRANHLAEQRWRLHGKKMSFPGYFPIYAVKTKSTLLAVMGLFRPRIYVSFNVLATLSSEELNAAMAHEVAHTASFDNIKQFILKITRPPRWFPVLRSLETVWSGGTEIAADQEAIARGASVFDLSQALIKVGRLRGLNQSTQLVASHLVPSCTDSALRLRVERLAALLDQSECLPSRAVGARNWAITSIACIGVYAICLQAVLPFVHEMLEVLVR